MCKLVATAAVMGLTLTELLAKNKAKKKYSKTTTELAQADALYTIANTHDDSKKANNTKVGIFGAIAACYGVAAVPEYNVQAGGNIKWAIKYTIYAGLAGTLATLSGISAKRHRKTSEKALASAKAIPRKGECHPGTPCFCAENREVSEAAHSMEFEANCIADELKRGDTTKLAMACLDARGKPDASCECKKNNSCLDSSLSQEIRNLNMDPKLKKHLNDSFSLIAGGEMSKKDIDKNRKKAGYFQKLAEKNADKALAGQKLSTGNSELAKAYNNAGMSKTTALLASNQKLTPAQRKNLAKLTGTTQASRYARAKSRKSNRASRVKQPSYNIDFGAADIFKQLQEDKKTAEMDPADRLAEFKRQRAQKRAMAMAEVNPMTNEPIFNIISQRYLKSGFIKVE